MYVDGVAIPGLHGRPISYKVDGEIVSDRIQTVENLVGSIDQVGFVVLDSPVLAETLDQVMSLFQVVPRQTRE